MGLFISTGVWAAGPLQTFGYQAHLPVDSNSCLESAQNWAARFAKATGLTPFQVACHGQVVDRETQATINSVSLKYSSESYFSPYVVKIGKKDLLDYYSKSRPQYMSYESCLADMPAQKALYQEATGLTPVTLFCGRDGGTIEPSFFMVIEGFATKPFVQPSKRLFSFIPHVMGRVTESYMDSVLGRLQNSQVMLAKVSEGAAFYYAAASVSMNHDYLLTLHSQQDCEVQKNAVVAIYQKIGADQAEVWCLQSREDVLSNQYSLEVLHNKSTSLMPAPSVNSPIYSQLDDCLKDKDAVLSDSRNMHFLGALCGPSFSHQGYEMYFF